MRIAQMTAALITSLISTAAFCEALSESTTKNVEKLVALSATGTNAYSIVESLTRDVGPRSAGSAGDRAGVLWALTALREAGLTNVRSERVAVPHWERGETRVSLPDFAASELVAVTLGGSVGTPEEGLRASVVRFESLAELRAAEAELVANKIVYIDQRMERAKSGAGYARVVPGRVRGASVAAAKGAIALLIRSVGTSESRIANTGSVIYSPGAPRIAGFALAHPDADRLSALLNKHGALEVEVFSSARSLGTTQSANVIGEVRGRGAPDEIVVLAAHLDSWDLGTGALDDGAGVAIMIEAAHQIGKLKPLPRRTIRVVLYANEEYGLSGARAYRADHDAELEQHIVAMESDFGAGPVYRFDTRVAESGLPLADQIASALAPLGIIRGGNEAFGGADIGPLREAGVPVFGLAQDGTNYFNYHHTVDDTLDKIDAADLDQNVAAQAIAAYIAAMAEGDFGRLASGASSN